MGSSQAAINRMVPAEDDAFARQFIDALRRADIATAGRSVAPELAGAQTERGLQQLVDILHGREPASTRILNVEGFYQLRTKRLNVTYEMTYPEDGWVLMTVGMVDSVDARRILSAQARTIPASAAAENAFTLAGKSAAEYAFLLLTVAMPLFILYTVIMVVRSDLRRRWLWALLALVGAVQFSLNWTTGALGVQPVHVQLLGAGVVRSGGPYLPWILSFSLPAGALAAWWKIRRSRLRPISQLAAEDEMPGAYPTAR